ncbi:hypothetical protein 2 [Hubei sobemo-like virus 22]|uniref:hypothetical protein 2 n=1 Tax=Hubei sobemo-like virus 22 TaxID=1923208 RepID=UPI00090BDCE1|nr:hypothetical protein 2 [Hubei sobemo-like virus 22]APG75972.1 hypothetical protein 2 [Hubei sobemo-like virus 22]
MLETAYESYKTATWAIPDDFLSREHYLRTLARLDLRSSPGYPYMLSAPTNRDWFRVSKDGTWDTGRVDQMWKIVQGKLAGQGADPIRIFIKPEPHKRKKIEEGRFRIISSVSVADQIVDHMLFAECNDALINNWQFVPNKAGWTHLMGGWKMIPAASWIAADKSAWDWTAKYWLFELVLSLRIMLCSNMSPEWMERAVRRYRELFEHPLFITSGGQLLRQKHTGIMKSGCVNTISDNSIMQYFLHLRVCLELGIEPSTLFAMGDDTLQEPVVGAEYFEYLGQFCRLKDWQRANEFAGFRFHGRTVEPLYKGKHAFNLLYMDPDNLSQMSDAYSLLYHRSRFGGWVKDIFNKMGVGVRSNEWFDLVFDGY